MAKGPISSAGKQKTLASFFGGNDKKPARKTSLHDINSDDAVEVHDEDVAMASEAENPPSSGDEGDMPELHPKNTTTASSGATSPDSDLEMAGPEVGSSGPSKKMNGSSKTKGAPAKTIVKTKKVLSKHWDEEVEDEPASKPKAKGKAPLAKKKSGKKDTTNEDDDDDADYGWQANLPPMSDIPSIFGDIIRRIPEIKDVAAHVKGRPLRVATMCSGTESPLLALELVTKKLKEDYGITLEFTHVFSCEIEPFKQAYIERNFHPPLLFRDVTELGQTHATTAYGALAPVPGDVDMLIAGTSCVDYSNLNNEKQDMNAGGESGRTFYGMLDWVKIHRPPIVILENVKGAPWGDVVREFEGIDYAAESLYLDTKKYYIPHTRQRGYLVAVNDPKSDAAERWAAMVKERERPASSTIDAFFLPADDPRVQLAREKYAKESSSVDRRAGRIDWSRCESRHQRERLEKELGNKRPFTHWEEGGYCKLPDFAWQDWGIKQVERVWDLMDISVIKAAMEGYDPAFKTQVWNLSQNVDRNIATKIGLSMCLTPSMIPYITNRGGPMIGQEALALQGLPIDNLLLTRETEDQLADLAGNAMSTTVVGTCMLSALVSAMSLLRSGDDTETYEVKGAGSRHKLEAIELDLGGMDVDAPLGGRLDDVEGHIKGEDELTIIPMDQHESPFKNLTDLLSAAQRSVRLCICEGRKEMTDRPLSRCRGCGSSSCVKCGGRPEHVMKPIDLAANPRLSPGAFEKQLKALLPMCISLDGVSAEFMDELKETNGVAVESSLWEKWKASVVRAANSELRFVEVKRQEIWTVAYESSFARAELSLHPQQCEWRFFAKAEPSETVHSPLRAWLENPIGRFRCEETGILSGRWQFAFPSSRKVILTIEGSGETVPSWEAQLGLQCAPFKDSEVFSAITLSMPEEDANLFERDIRGIYTLFDKCGTAKSALHKREAREGEEALPPLFLLFDPTRTGDISKDSFAISISRRRYDYGETRPVIARLDPSWKQSSMVGPQTTQCTIPTKWVEAPMISLIPSSHPGTYAVPSSVLNVQAANHSCASATALLTCRVELRGELADDWVRGDWYEVDKVHELATFKQYAWLFENVPPIEHFSSWQTVSLPHEFHDCLTCAPLQPSLAWAQAPGKIKKMIGIENVVEAGEYERRLKRRPPPFVTQLKRGNDGTGILRIGANLSSLIHRALSRLPTLGRTERAVVSWRLQTDFVPMIKLELPKFNLLSNRPDPEHEQPPHFKLPLRPEQLRSLSWMLDCESTSAPPFIEEEISEATLDALGWRIEGRAQRPVLVRGGVLADEVGYGKTAISLGLIDCAANDVKKEFQNRAKIPGKILTKATLVIVPPHLARQWPSEVKKFLGSSKKVVSLIIASDLNRTSISDIIDADIVVVASNLFQSSVYLDNLVAMAAGGDLPAQEGRYFDARRDHILKTLRGQVDRLREEGGAAVMAEIKAARVRWEEEKAAGTIGTKRLKGKSYRDAKSAEEKAKSTGDAKFVVKAEPAVKLESDGENKYTAKPGPSGKIMEVIIPRFFNKPVPRSAPTAADSKTVENDERNSRPQRGAATKRKAIVISDDDDEISDTDAKSKRLPKRPTKKPATSARSSGVDSSSDYDDKDFSEGEEDDDAESDAVSESEPETEPDEDVKKKKGKAKAKPPKKPAQRPAVTKTPAKKQKVEKEVKPRKLREATDPWGLKGAKVRDDWTEMLCPPLEMFHFARKVIDEYTYLEGRILSLVTQVSADRHWVLSGTPPVHSFTAVKSIARFLDLHLGVDDEGEATSQKEVKEKRKAQTAVEKFHSFREAHSLEWHAHRHEVGQQFLNRFVRQNIAEIDEIPWTDHIQSVLLPAAERAIYLELEHHLRSIEMTVKKAKKNESDREKRLNQSLGDSKTAEEALLKRCSHFDLDTQNLENAMKSCEIIVRERTRQLDECKANLLRELKNAVKKEQTIGPIAAESSFREYIRITKNEGVGDRDATEIVVGLLQEAGVNAPLKTAASSARSGPVKGKSGKGKARKDDDDIDQDTKDKMWELRELTHDLRRITKELVGRVRSLRYFGVVRDLQKQRDEPPVVDCPGCERKNIPMEEVAVLSSCGHTGCLDCVVGAARREECVCGPQICNSAARVLNVVRGETLGVDETRENKGKPFGKKLEDVIALLKNDIPKKERVLIFVQFPDLMEKVAAALKANGVKFLEIRGSAAKKSKNLEEFQNADADTARVLLLNVTDESASGANLTSANHVIFLSPLLTETQEIYDASETQAIGRVKRFGQRKHVHIYRFLTVGTIDEEIYTQRRPKDDRVKSTMAF